MKTYEEILTDDEIQLLCGYISDKILIFKKAKDELIEELKNVDEEKLSKENRELLSERKKLIREFSRDIDYYGGMITKLTTGAKAGYADVLELWCMADNKEHYDKMHNELHLSIVSKLKEYNDKQSKTKRK